MFHLHEVESVEIDSGNNSLDMLQDGSEQTKIKRGRDTVQRIQKTANKIIAACEKKINAQEKVARY